MNKLILLSSHLMAKPGNHAIALGGQGSAPAVQHRQLALPLSVRPSLE